jgi:hypothetical protein
VRRPEYAVSFPQAGSCAPKQLPGRGNDQEEKFKREFGHALSVCVIWIAGEIPIEFRNFCESPRSNLIQG